jgi:hypothetical protein
LGIRPQVRVINFISDDSQSELSGDHRSRRARLRQQNLSLGLTTKRQSKPRFDLTWKQTQDAPTSLDFVAIVEDICRVKSFELVSGREH